MRKDEVSGGLGAETPMRTSKISGTAHIIAQAHQLTIEQQQPHRENLPSVVCDRKEYDERTSTSEHLHSAHPAQAIPIVRRYPVLRQLLLRFLSNPLLFIANSRRLNS